MTIDADYIDRWRAHIKPFPLPEFRVPTEPNVLDDIPDSVLLDAPPQLIAHIQRTVSQGGLQVISPRQTPITWLMTRTDTPERQLGDHIVGSVADEYDEWPTIDGASFDELLPDEPLHRVDESAMLKEKTRTEPLTRAGTLLKDPIIACLVKGRATIDVLARDDVAGGAQEMAELLGAAWGLPTEDIMDMDAFTIGFQGPLLRHAIKADEVFPMVHAPIHRKKSISVGATEINRTLLPFDSAMDWRRMRTFCEAIFLMSCSIEGYPLKMMRCYPPPGDPAAPANRDRVMAFLPAPCTAWSFVASTFSICPIPPTEEELAEMGSVPPEVYAALARYVEVVRPVSFAMKVGARPTTHVTALLAAHNPPGETISSAYSLLSRHVFTGTSRGRTSASTVRNLIYETFESASPDVQMRVSRYIYIAKSEVREHLGLTEVPDAVIDRLAVRFLTIGDLIRQKVAAEGARRGYSVAEWWADLTAQAPVRYMSMTEGTMGWAKVSLWLLFRQPTEKWANLVKALNYQSMRMASRKSVGGIPLPAGLGTMERLVAAARHVAKAVSKTYAGFYSGVSDVGLVISDVAADMGLTRTSEVAREAAYLWLLRARALRGANVQPIASHEEQKSTNYFRIRATPVDLLLVPAPYRAFNAYRTHAEHSKLVPPDIAKHLRDFSGPRISAAFQVLKRPIVACKQTLLTRYLTAPNKLGSDMEKAWRELTDDLRATALIYGATPAPPPDKKRKQDDVPALIPRIDLTPIMRRKVDERPGLGYFDIYGEMTPDEVDWLDSKVDRLPDSVAGIIMERRYADKKELTDLVREHEAGLYAGVGQANESVI